MSAQDHSPSVVERLTHTFSEWLRHRRELSEMRHLNAAEFDRIASDLRLSPADLDELVRHGPHAADELPKLLQALGISQDDLARIEPMVLHDMERVCALCVTSANAITILLREPQPNTTRSIALTRRRSRNWASGNRNSCSATSGTRPLMLRERRDRIRDRDRAPCDVGMQPLHHLAIE